MGHESFLPLFFGDFLASTYTWDGEEQGLYLLLLGYQWTNGPLPSDIKRLAKAVRHDLKRFSALWETVGTKFESSGCGLVNARLEEHRAYSVAVCDRKSNAARAGAAARWQRDSDSRPRPRSSAPGDRAPRMGRSSISRKCAPAGGTWLR